MSIKEKQVQLARYRLKQAKETVDEAEYLFEGGKSPRSVINRAYYAMYYSILALLIFEQFVSSKHSGMLSFFNKQYIKNEKSPKEMGRWINKAFELRQQGDYRECADLAYEQVEPYIEYAKTFIQRVEEYLGKNRFA